MDKLVIEMYNVLMDINIPIFGLNSYRKSMKMTKAEFTPLMHAFFQTYDWPILKKTLRSLQGKGANNIRNSKPIKYSDTSKLKMSISINKFWNDPDNIGYITELKKLSKHNMEIHCAPKNRTKEAAAKRVESRRNNNKVWHTEETKTKISDNQIGKVISKETRALQSLSAKARGNCMPENYKASPETRAKLSAICKQQWIDGIHKPIFKSKGHILIEKILIDLGYTIESEKTIKGRPFDIFVSELNLVIEFNGTYWHMDPAVYNSNHYDVSMNRYAKDVWEVDRKKNQLAIDSGHVLLVIWQRELETAENIIDFIKQKIII